MSDGGAGALVKILEVPVLREVAVCVLWYGALCHALETGEWHWFGWMSLVGVVGGLVYWYRYNRNRKDTGGGGILLLVVFFVIVLAPLLFVAARRRKAKAGVADAG